MCPPTSNARSDIEKLFPRALESLGVGWVEVEGDHRAVAWNGAAGDLLGLPSSDTQTVDIGDIFLHSDNGKIRHAPSECPALVAGRGGECTIEDIRPANDTAVAIQYVVQPVAISHVPGRRTILLRRVGPAHDGPAGVDDEGLLLRRILASPETIAVAVDANGTVLSAPGALGSAGADAVLGTSVFDYIPSQDHPILRNALRDVFAKGEGTDYEIRALGFDGSLRSYKTRAIPLTVDGRTMAAVLVSRDVTETRRLEKETRALREELETLRDSQINA